MTEVDKPAPEGVQVTGAATGPLKFIVGRVGVGSVGCRA